MTTLEPTAVHPQGVGGTPPPPASSAQGRIGLAFVSLYTLFLIVFGVLPSLYAIYLAFTKQGAFVSFANFIKVFKDYRFLPAVEHVGLFVLVWLVALVVLVVVLALVVHSVGLRRFSATMRFLYYIPGALAGASGVMLWLFVLDPTVSPVAFLLHALGFNSLVETVQADRLPLTLAVIAFWTGAGGWIVVMYGALNNISRDLIEGGTGRGRAGTHRLVDPDPADAQVDRLYGDPELCRRHAALRRAARAVAGEPRRRLAGLFAQPARLPLRLQAERLQRLGGHLAGAAGGGTGTQHLLRVQGRPV